MNIFYIDNDPVQAAQWMVDKHVVKMILESAQLLSTAHRVIDGEPMPVVKQVMAGATKVSNKVKTRLYLGDARESVLYKETHINHPSAIWARQSIENYNWLVEHFFALMDEYTYRYEKKHKCSGEISYMLQSPPKLLEKYEWTDMPSCMDDEYKLGNDPIVNYRNYYKVGKTKLHKWTRREPPIWIKD